MLNEDSKMKKRLLKVAAYLKSQGLYKEAAQIKKIAIELEEGRYVTLKGKKYDLDDMSGAGAIAYGLKDVLEYDANAQKYHGGPALEKLLMDSPYADTNAELWGIGMQDSLPIFWNFSMKNGFRTEHLQPLIEHAVWGDQGPKFDKRMQNYQYPDTKEFLTNEKYLDAASAARAVSIESDIARDAIQAERMRQISEEQN